MYKKMTKDELFLVKLYEEALKKGGLFIEIDRYIIGQLIGQNDKSVDNMVRMLTQTNFIKKASGNSVTITSQGEAFVQTLKQ